MGSARRHGATKPLGITEKFRESRFFLVCMAEYERLADIKKFLFCLSAFLSAFGSIRYRVLGVETESQGETAMFNLEQKLNDHPRIGFLSKLRNVEVHRDGVTVWPLYHLADFTKSTPGPLELHFFPTIPNQVRVIGFRFGGHPQDQNLIEFCHDTLNDFEEISRQLFPHTS